VTTLLELTELLGHRQAPLGRVEGTQRLIDAHPSIEQNEPLLQSLPALPDEVSELLTGRHQLLNVAGNIMTRRDHAVSLCRQREKSRTPTPVERGPVAVRRSGVRPIP
jgi:hypothetical protein